MLMLTQMLTGSEPLSPRLARMPGREGLMAMLRTGDLSASFIAGTPLAAMVWGAGHALTPGHGKAIVGAYLIGARSTPWHAVYLGLTVTLTHSLRVFALGLVALFASQYVLPEQLYPWLGVLSGLIVAGMGLFMLRNRVVPLIARKIADRRNHQPHGHSHSHTDGHPHDHGHGHSHLPPGADGSPVTWRSLLLLGVSGGILPCPSALVLLLAAVSMNRVAFGMALVVVFSFGLAAVLTVVGLLFVKGSAVVQRVPRFTAWQQYIPVASAVVITVLGVVLMTEAAMRLGL
jgi:ABC-type nickel/cobalt efflux system permease component RcnA